LVHSEELKLQAALYAVKFVKSGMIVGLGHGSTALKAIELIARSVEQGLLKDILCIPASDAVQKDAEKLKLPLTTLNEHPVLDITIDGADEANPDLNLIKGGGGALLKEKMLAQASMREVIIIDQSKLSPVLGTKWAVPVEVIPFGWRYQAAFIEQLGAVAKLRLNSGGTPYETDQGNLILDCNFGPIEDPAELAALLNQQAGIAEHGLFIGLTDDLVIAGESGIRHLQKDR
jgi:ribose 5-phosphate isomerase A